MRKWIVFTVLSLLISVPAAAGPEDEVREAETNFAKAFAGRDLERFASFLAPDATFIVAGKPVVGAEAVVKAWSAFLNGPTVPFSWKSEQALVDASGTTAMSLGGVYDPSGKRIGSFTSFWRKQNGEWKVVFDGPPAPVCRDVK